MDLSVIEEILYSTISLKCIYKDRLGYMKKFK
jgi:hypothetical protein